MTVAAYKDHPLHNTIQEVLRLQEEPSMADPSIVDNEQYTFARDKISAIAQVVHSLLDSTPAVLASVHAMNQLQKHVQASLVELNAYVSDKNPTHITNASTQFEQNVLPLLWGFVPQVPAELATVLPDLFERMSRSTSDTINQLMTERDTLIQKLQETTTLAESLKTNLEAMSEAAAKERAEASAEVAKLEQVFTTKETERAATFEAALSKAKGDYSTLEQETKADGAALVSSLEDQLSKAAQIVQVVGNIGVTGNYQTNANSEARQANFWRWITVAFFAGGVSIAVATFVRFWGETVTVEGIWSISVRLLYAIAITAPAWYTAKESARHRTNSDRARQTELELASLGPFIELLPPDKKIEITEQMTKLYFGREIDAHTSKPPLDVETVKDLAIELAKAFKK